MNDERSDRTINWIIIGALVMMAIATILILGSWLAAADGGGEDDSYKIGVDTTVSPAQYRYLYMPVYTAGNNTRVTFQINVAQTGGQGNDKFWVELLDNENMLLKLTDTTSYHIYTAGTSTRAVTTYGFDLTLSRDAGWRDGVYWIVVDKDFPGNTWCWVSYEYSYETDAPGVGGLVEKEIARVDQRIDDLVIAQQAIEVDLEDLRIDLQGMNDLIVELQAQAGALEENDTGIREWLEEVAALIGQAQQQVEAAVSALEDDIDALNLSFYMQLRTIEDALSDRLTIMEEELLDTTSRLSTVTNRELALEVEVQALEDRVDELEELLQDAETNITDLEGQEIPEDSDVGVLAIGVIALGVAGTAVAMGVRSKKGGEA